MSEGDDDQWVLELEPEVLEWLDDLTQSDYDTVERHADRLLEQPTTLSEPASRHLGDGLRELRFILCGEKYRITYWLAAGKRIVLLTRFRKTKQREEAQVARARQAMKECQATHGPAEHTYEREEGS